MFLQPSYSGAWAKLGRMRLVVVGTTPEDVEVGVVFEDEDSGVELVKLTSDPDDRLAKSLGMSEEKPQMFADSIRTVEAI